MELYESLKLKSKNKTINPTETEIYEEMKEKKEHLMSQIGSCRYSIDNFTKQLKDTNEKIDGIEGRLKDLDDKNCPICSNKITNPVITPCCKNAFCLECLITALSYSSTKSSCPMCMTVIDKTKLKVIMKSDKKIKDKSIGELPTKDERIKELLTKYSDGRFLIFSEFDGSFHKIARLCEELGIHCSKVNGTPGHIRNIIEKYKSGEYRVLFLNAKNFGAGLNLQMTTDIILYHNMSSDLEKQVVGRGQRLGRTSALRIHYLTYEHEYTTKKKIVDLDESPETVPDVVLDGPIVNTDSISEDS
jgi:SNF2 family DNA or RNA helicase